VDCVPYKEDFVVWRFVISRFYNIRLYFIVTLVGLRSIVCDKSDCNSPCNSPCHTNCKNNFTLIE